MFDHLFAAIDAFSLVSGSMPNELKEIDEGDLLQPNIKNKMRERR